MSMDLDNIMAEINSAANICYDLNRNGELPNAEQVVFYQYAEHSSLMLTQMHIDYDEISDGLAQKPDEKNELYTIWAQANADLLDFSRALTSPKMRAAVASMAYALDRTASIINGM